MSRFAICTLSNEDCQDIYSVTNPIKEEYSQRHGCEFLLRLGFFPYETVFYDRLRWFHDVALRGNHEWLLCCGTDVLLTNHTIPLEAFTDAVNPDCQMIIARDALMFNSDVFLLRYSKLGLMLMQEWFGLQPQFSHAEKDQLALEYLFKIPRWRTMIKVVPQRYLQSYDYDLYRNLGGNYTVGLDAGGNDGQWRQGDFALHVPAHRDRKAQILSSYLGKIIR